MNLAKLGLVGTFLGITLISVFVSVAVISNSNKQPAPQNQTQSESSAPSKKSSDKTLTLTVDGREIPLDGTVKDIIDITGNDYIFYTSTPNESLDTLLTSELHVSDISLESVTATPSFYITTIVDSDDEALLAPVSDHILESISSTNFQTITFDGFTVESAMTTSTDILDHYEAKPKSTSNCNSYDYFDYQYEINQHKIQYTFNCSDNHLNRFTYYR